MTKEPQLTMCFQGFVPFVPAHNQVSGRSDIGDVALQLELSALQHFALVVPVMYGDAVWSFCGHDFKKEE